MILFLCFAFVFAFSGACASLVQQQFGPFLGQAVVAALVLRLLLLLVEGEQGAGVPERRGR